MRAILLFFALTLAAPALFAQVAVGAEGGIGMAYTKYSPAPYLAGHSSPIASVKLGALLDVPLNKHLTFQSGLYFCRRGGIRYFTAQVDSFTEEYHQNLFLNYADVPVMLYYKTGMQGKGRIIAGIGPNLSYIVGGKNDITDQFRIFGPVGYTNNRTLPVTNGRSVSSFDIGLNMTAGYELPTGPFFRCSYITGSQDIGKGSELTKNRSWCVTGGYLFGKKHNINKEADDLIDHSVEAEGQK